MKRAWKAEMLVAWKMLRSSIPLFKTHGTVEEDTFTYWCKATFGLCTAEDLRTATTNMCRTWDSNFAPSLPKLLAYIGDAKKAREINDQMKGRSDPGRGLEQAPAKSKEAKKEFMKKFKEISKRIHASSTSREPSPGDVESFAESYRRLGLNQRFGPLPEIVPDADC